MIIGDQYARRESTAHDDDGFGFSQVLTRVLARSCEVAPHHLDVDVLRALWKDGRAEHFFVSREFGGASPRCETRALVCHGAAPMPLAGEGPSEDIHPPDCSKVHRHGAVGEEERLGLDVSERVAEKLRQLIRLNASRPRSAP